MNTKNIFRTLFMAVLLLVGANSAKAGFYYESSEGERANIVIEYGDLDDCRGAVLRFTYELDPNDNPYWTPPYQIIIANNKGGDLTIDVTGSGTYDLNLDDTFFKVVNTTDPNNKCAVIRTANLKIYKIEIVNGSDTGNTSYILTYMVDGRQYGDTETHEAGDNITPRAEPPAKQGYTFSGWSGLPADGKMPANNVTVTGYYTRDYVTAPIDSYGYATFSSSSPLDFSSVRDVKAYIAQQVSDDMVELVQIMGTCAAGTGLVLIGENNNNPGYQVPVATTDGVDYSNQNLLKAVLSSTYINSSTDFVLTYQNGGVVFAATGNREATIPAGHAYLEWSQGSNARALKVVVAGETTGVNAVENALTGNEVIYNLRGQRVVNPGKGVYIINGKKVVLK